MDDFARDYSSARITSDLIAMIEMA